MSRRGRGGTPISLFSFQDIITSVTGIMILVTLFLGLEVIRRKEGSPQQQTVVLTDELRQAANQTSAAREQSTANNEELNRLRKRLEEEGEQLQEELVNDAERLKRQLHDLEQLNQTLDRELNDSNARRQAAEKSREELEAIEKSRTRDRQTLEELIREATKKREQLAQLKSNNRVIFNAGTGDGKVAWLVELGGKRIYAARVGKKEVPQKFDNVQGLVNWAKKLDRRKEFVVLLAKPDVVEEFHKARPTLESFGLDLGYDLLGREQTAIDPVTGAAAP